MKKLLILFAASFSISAASAQSRDNNYNTHDRYQAIQTKNDRYNDQHQSNDWAYNKTGRNDDRDRQAAFDHMNQQYDKRINDYKNDRSLNRYERDRRIRQAEQERQQQSRIFGKGMVVGGIVGLVLGAILSH